MPHSDPKHRPLGPNGTWKTGQRVPTTSDYEDQYKVRSTHFAGGTFPPCVGRGGECAFRRPVAATSTSAATEA